MFTKSVSIPSPSLQLGEISPLPTASNSALAKIKRSLSIRRTPSICSLSSMRDQRDNALRGIDRQFDKIARKALSKVPLVSVKTHVPALTPAQNAQGQRNSKFLDDEFATLRTVLR